MKTKIYIIFLLSVLLARQAYSQHSFAPLGAEWWYYSVYSNSTDDPDPVTGLRFRTNSTFHTQSVKDTLVNGIACRKVITDIRSVGNDIFRPYNMDYYFYDNADTVFIYNENFNRFTPLFVYNAQEGDTICLPVPPTPGGPSAPDLRPNPISGDTSFCFVLDSVRVLLYDTAHLKTYFVHTLVARGTGFEQTAYPAYTWGRPFGTPEDRFTGTYVERIAGDFLPTRITSIVHSNPVTYAPYDTLRCYSDSFYSLKFVPEACDTLYPIPVGINDPKPARELLQLYPNPAGRQLKMLFNAPLQQEVSLSFFDITGRAVFQTMVVQGARQAAVDVQQWSNGLYLLRLQRGAAVYYEKIAVSH